MSFVYRISREGNGGRLYTVGYFMPKTFDDNVTEYQWVGVEESSNEQEARQLVNYLNGGSGAPFKFSK